MAQTLLTFVTLALDCLVETRREFVEEMVAAHMECGVEPPPTVKVLSLYRLIILQIHYLQLLDQIMCLALSKPDNGRIEYSSNSTGDQTFGVKATYICNSGFGLSGEVLVRTCEGDGSSPDGNWTGMAPLCSG